MKGWLSILLALAFAALATPLYADPVQLTWPHARFLNDTERVTRDSPAALKNALTTWDILVTDTGWLADQQFLSKEVGLHAVARLRKEFNAARAALDDYKVYFAKTVAGICQDPKQRALCDKELSSGVDSTNQAEIALYAMENRLEDMAAQVETLPGSPVLPRGQKQT